MLSAVESNSHLGSSRAYNVHHHLAYGSGAGVGPSPSITAGTGLNSYPTNGVVPATEFVKPHPKLSRYSSLPSSRAGNGLPPSPVSSANSKFKYASAAATEQPVNLAMGSPSATSSPISSPQSAAMPPGMDKLSFAEFMYSRHAAAAAAGFLAPQNYGQLMYPNSGPAPNGLSSFGQPPSPHSLKQQQQQHIGKGSSTMSPPGANGDRNGPVHMSSEVLLNGHRYQQQQQQQQQQYHHQQQLQQKALKGSSAGNGFILPPPPSMIPTQAELEAFHAYHEMGNRLYYNGPPPPPDQMMNAQRMHSSNMQPQQQQQQPQSPHQTGKRAIQDPGMYLHQRPPPPPQHNLKHRPQQQQQQQQQPQQNGGKGAGNPQDKNNNIGFKVPSGKEGPLKNRLGTKGRGKGKQNGMKVANNNNNSSYGTSNIVKSNFNKGVLIELGNGELKPVEEMRTEDFILSSNVSPDLELIDSTILRIMQHGNLIVLTLSNSASKLNIDLTVAPEHPFFVYRQGWASCNPDGTYQMHGLKCQRLNVGDVCISLMQKEHRGTAGQEPIEENLGVRTNSGSSLSSSTSSSLSSPPPQPQPQHQPHHQHQQQQQQQQQQQEEPQNLSRKPSPKDSSRALIEGTTYHPSLTSPSSIAPPLPPLPHHSSSLFRNGHAEQGQGGGGNPLVNSFLSTFKHNYLAAFEAAKAMNGGNGLSHSIKNIVEGDSNNHHFVADGRYPPQQYSPNAGSPEVNSASSSSLSPGLHGGGSTKRRYSAPDNVFGEVDVGRTRDGRLDHEEPPKKIASH